MITRPWHGAVPPAKAEGGRRPSSPSVTAPLALAGALMVASCSGGGGRAGSTVAQRIEALLADYRGNDRPGACILARSRGAIVYRRCFGLISSLTVRE